MGSEFRCGRFQRASSRIALSFLSVFSGQVQAAASAGRIRNINGLPGFSEKRSERDPVTGYYV
jgi:hypothetical protein